MSCLRRPLPNGETENHKGSCAQGSRQTVHESHSGQGCGNGNACQGSDDSLTCSGCQPVERQHQSKAADSGVEYGRHDLGVGFGSELSHKDEQDCPQRDPGGNQDLARCRTAAQRAGG